MQSFATNMKNLRLKQVCLQKCSHHCKTFDQQYLMTANTGPHRTRGHQLATFDNTSSYIFQILCLILKFIMGFLQKHIHQYKPNQQGLPAKKSIKAEVICNHSLSAEGQFWVCQAVSPEPRLAWIQPLAPLPLASNL